VKSKYYDAPHYVINYVIFLGSNILLSSLH